MKLSFQNATKVITTKIPGILLLALLNTTALVHAQHFQNNSSNNNSNNTTRYSSPTPPPSRPAQSETRSESRESTYSRPQSRPAAEESRPRAAGNSRYDASPVETEPASIRSRPSVSTPHALAAPELERSRPVSGPGPRITVNRPSNNVRVLPDGTRLVNEGNRGFVEHPIPSQPGYVARTYVAGGQSYVQVYRQASFQGFGYDVYVPAVYYRPTFYQWAYNPWAEPIYFPWGWNAAPWYGAYGGYLTPSPIYSLSALWLTDYLLAQDLEVAYENQQQIGDNASSATAGQPVPLTPEVKQAIAVEVEQQIATEQAAAAAGNRLQTTSTNATPPALDPTQRVFVVSTTIEARMGDQACALTPGDVILRTSDTIGADGKVGVSILSSKRGDCPINSISALDFSTLQEMHNEFRAQIDSGLGFLAANEGKNGLPQGPSAGPSSVTQGWATPDGNAESELLKQKQDAVQAELE